MTGSSILREILDRGEGFGHRQHLELTWRSLENQEPETALATVSDEIRHVATAHGAPHKYHATITSGWLRCVAAHRERWPAESFGAFIERNPSLLDPRLLEHYFSPDLLGSDAARSSVVEPDRHALPALAT
jgi:hypothetical protein